MSTKVVRCDELRALATAGCISAGDRVVIISDDPLDGYVSIPTTVHRVRSSRIINAASTSVLLKIDSGYDWGWEDPSIEPGVLFWYVSSGYNYEIETKNPLFAAARRVYMSSMKG